MAKSDKMRQKIAELEAQLNGKVSPVATEEATPQEEAPKPKKRSRTVKREQPVDVDGSVAFDSIQQAPPVTPPVEPGPLEYDSITDAPKVEVEPMKVTPVSELNKAQENSVQASTEPQAAEAAPEPQGSKPASEPMTPEEMRAKADAMKEHLQAEMDRIEAQRKRCEDKIKALEEAAAEVERKEAEARAKAEEEARKAEELAKAQAEAKAKAEAELFASINRSERHVGKAYRYWDYETATWNLVTDVWAANQLSDKWEAIYVWYVDGQVERLLNKEEIARYCPRS